MAERGPRLTVESHRYRGKTIWSWVCDDHRIIPSFATEEEAREALARHLVTEVHTMQVTRYAPPSEGSEGKQR